MRASQNEFQILIKAISFQSNKSYRTDRRKFKEFPNPHSPALLALLTGAELGAPNRLQNALTTDRVNTFRPYFCMDWTDPINQKKKVNAT